jgi:hypothetical protein
VFVIEPCSSRPDEAIGLKRDIKPSPLVKVFIMKLQHLYLSVFALAQNAIQRQNGIDAQRLDSQKFTNRAGDSCTAVTCAGNELGQCVGGRIVTTPCGSGLICAVLPLVNAPGTSVTCTTEEDRNRRFAAAGVGSPEQPAPSNQPAPAPPTQPETGPSVPPTQPPVPTSTAGAANTFECIDDTRFRLFSGNGQFTIGSCPPGFCATRTPPNKNPCVGRANADRIDGTGNGNTGTTNPLPPRTQNSNGAPNTFQCIDDTQFRMFTGNGQSIVGSCPPGFCFTRTPPNKNPCVGRANAQRIDGTA